MPAAALLGPAVWLLARDAARRPLGAPVAFGLVMGLAAYVRAVALPLVALAALHFRARGRDLRARHHPHARGGGGRAAGFAPLGAAQPPPLRRALPDRQPRRPHRAGRRQPQLRRVLQPLAQPAVRRGDRLRAVLVASSGSRIAPPTRWPSSGPRFRRATRSACWRRRPIGCSASSGRCSTGRSTARACCAPGNWFDVHRAGVERLVDGSWFLFVAAIALGIVAAAARRNWPALTLLPLPLALTALYAIFFAEARYHLAIVVLLLPFAGEGLAWLAAGLRDVVRRPAARRRVTIEALVAAGVVALIFVGWPRLMAAGATLRERNRWAVCVCEVGGGNRLCDVRATEPTPGQTPSPVRGVWDGFGLRLAAARVAAGFDVDLPPDRYRVSMRAEGMGGEVRAAVDMSADGTNLAQTSWPQDGTPITLTGVVTHAGGKLRVEVGAGARNSNWRRR